MIKYLSYGPYTRYLLVHCPDVWAGYTWRPNGSNNSDSPESAGGVTMMKYTCLQAAEYLAPPKLNVQLRYFLS